MPIWQDAPPSNGQHLPYRLIRVPATGRVAGIITSPTYIGTSTHYVRNRTIPCDGEAACPACREGYSSRWHCYLSLILRGSWEHVILELTANAADPLRNYRMQTGDLRGVLLTATRPSARPNGRIVVTCQPTDPNTIRLPEPPNVQRILCHLWGVPYKPNNTTLTQALADAITPKTPDPQKP